MLRTSLGTAAPAFANTLIPPLTGDEPDAEEADGEETKDQRPSAVTATPNEFPWTGMNRTSAAGSFGAAAVAVPQPTPGTGAGPAVAAGLVLAVPAVHAASASAAVPATRRHDALTPPR